jgi:NitT/TauT family transport system substrate-binding protein
MVKRRLLLVAGLAASCSMPAVSFASSGRLTPVRVVVQNPYQIKQLPLLLAERLGYFRSEGLDIEWQAVPASSHTLDLLARWPADVFAGTFERTVMQHVQHQPHRAFVLMSRAPQVVLGVPTATWPLRAGVQDLVGGSIGVAASGALSHRVARWILMRGGLRGTDVNFVELPDAARAMEAFTLGEIDAISYTDPLITRLEQGGFIRVISDTRSLRESEQVFGGPVLCTCLSASDAFIDQHPEVCQALANAVVRALKWLHTATPSDLIAHVPAQFMGGDRGLFLAALNKSRQTLATDGLIPALGPINVMKALDRLQLNLPLSKIDPAATYTNRFAQKAKAQFQV